MNYEKKYVDNDIKKMISGIDAAKQILKENPNDHWVKKGLAVMNEYLSQLIAISENKLDK
jgi:hypothetical protein